MQPLSSADADLLRYQHTLHFPPDLERAYRDDYYHKSVGTVRAICGLAMVVYGLFALVDYQALPTAYHTAWELRVLGEMMLVATLLFTFTRYFKPVQFLISNAMLLALAISVLALFAISRPQEPAFLFYPIGLMFTIITAYASTGHVRYATVGGWLSVGGYGFAAVCLHRMTRSQDTTLQFTLTLCFLGGMNLIGMMLGYIGERSNRRDFLQRRMIEQQRADSERLLLNVLPAPVAARLKRGEIIADAFDEASVLFADIVDFTPFSAGKPPAEIVALLNDVFSTFDRLAEKHGLEKIKTIGDSYMVVSGVPTPRPDHAHVLAEMALEMQAAMLDFRNTGQAAMHLRIGMNSGPVIAGVIGLQKFIYDLWGDTVNTASRMEAHGMSGKIQVTESVYILLKEGYTFEPRGIVSIKGKGEMPVFLLTGRGAARS